MRRKIALLATTLLVRTAAAQQAVVIPDTVVTAARTPLPVTRIPAGVTVIGRQAIEDSGATTLGDLLSGVPGLHVSPSGGPGGQSSVFMRGTNSSHVLVLRDGMPVNDASESSGAFNFGIDTLTDIERIEIVRGPMASLYGSGAVGGVINLISRRGTEGKPRLEFNIAGGYPEAVTGAASASGVVDKFDYALTAEAQSRRGFDAVPQRQSIRTGIPQGFRDRIMTANLGYTPVDGTRLSVFLRGRETLFGFNTLGTGYVDPVFGPSGFATYDAANSSGSTASLLGRIGGTSLLLDGAYETGLFLGRSQDDRRYAEPLVAADPNMNSMDDRYHAYRTDLQWNNTVHLASRIAPSWMSLADVTFGYQHTIDTIDVRVNSSSGGFPFQQGARAGMVTDAAHTGFTAELWNNLTLTGQVRQDQAGGENAATWRLGAVLNVPAVLTRVHVAYGTAFRAASLFERFGVDSYGYTGNPSLRPEHAEGGEAGFVTTLPLHGQKDGVSIGATWFDQRIRDLIVNVFAPTDTSVNVGAGHLRGVEFEAGLHPVAWLTLRATYTFTEATDDTGTELSRRPRHAASMDASVTPLDRARIVVRAVYTGPARDYLYDNQSFGIGNGIGQHGLVVNATASYDLTPRVQLRLDGTNIFNSRFEPVNGYQIPGATVLMGVRVRL